MTDVAPSVETVPLILVVDDTEGTRYSVSRVLKNEGYRVIEAVNGTDALKIADEQLPDLTILDIHLPDMLGFEVCRRMKAAPRTARTPVLQISASYVSSKDRINGLEGGADSYLTHPVEPPVLAATVRALLRMRDLNRQLAVTDERLGLALKVAPIALFELDRDLKVKWFHYPRSHGPVNEVIGHRLDEHSTGPQAEALVKLQREVLGSGETARTIFRSTKDGVLRYYDLRYDPIRGLDGEIKGLIGVGVDITERELAKQENERARDAAEAANRAKSQFIANVSHEIRTPLGVIMGFSDLILESGNDSREDNIKSVGVIRRNATQLLRLIDEVLDLSKVEADKMDIESLRFDLIDLVEDVISNMSLRAREKSVALSVKFETSVPLFVKSDPLRLRQILMNLLGNSLKFTERGSILLRISSTPIRDGEPATLKFIIEDTGIGIAPDQSARLFEAFVQADASMTRRFGGTGLGLMLSRKLSQALGGDLQLLRSEPGKGSAFELTIVDPTARGPLYEGSKPRDATSTSLAPAAPVKTLSELSVLLVEDSPDNQVMLQRFLTQAGASVQLASDGQAGIEKAQTGKYDVVLMDIQMPVLDGYQATRTLRSQGFKPPIIALTAHALKGEREKCLEAGFSDYLTKPVDRQLLITKIREMTK